MNQEINKTNVAIKSASSVVYLVIMAIGSIFLSMVAVKSIVFGGLQSAWGFEFVLCLFAPLPGLFGYFIAFAGFFRNYDFATRSILSVASGIFVAVIIMTALHSAAISNFKREKAVQAEQKIAVSNKIDLFKKVLSGSPSSNEIRQYLIGTQLTVLEKEAFKNMLYETDRPKISASTISILLDVFKEDSELLGYLADQPETTIEDKSRVVNIYEKKAVLPMSANSKTPSEVLLKLATYPDDEVSSNVQKNMGSPAIAKAIATIRSRYNARGLPEWETKNKYLLKHEDELNAWMALASDRRPLVRSWVARDDTAPSQILTGMASEESEYVLPWLMLNKNAPNSTKEAVAIKRSTSVRDLLDKYASNSNSSVKQKIASFQDLDPKTLNKLTTDVDFFVRAAVAKNLNTPVQDLEKLSKDSNWIVVDAVKNNPNTPPEIRQKLQKKK